MSAHSLKIEGMSCRHCVMALRKELEKVRGLKVNSVDIGKADISWTGDKADEAALKEAVEEAGFKLVN